MVNDGGRAFHAAIDGAALHAVVGVLHGFLIRPIGNRDALHADGVARGVHHDEHVFEAAVFLAHQIADGAAVVAVLQHRRGRCLDAHLVLDADAVHVVALAERPVLIHQELRHHEQADALHSLGRALHARQHQVDDVVRHVVLAVGDEDLGAEDLVRAIGLRLGARAHLRQIAAGLRLGQVHGAGPVARHQFFEVGGLELVTAGREQRLGRAIGQQRAQRKAQVGRVEHLDAGGANGFRQALTAEIRRVLQALPAAFGVLLVRVLEAFAGGDRRARVGGRRLVGVEVEWRHHLFVEARAFFQHRLRRLQARVLEAGHLRDLADARQVLDVEQHVLDGGLVAHGFSPVILVTKKWASRAMPLPDALSKSERRATQRAWVSSGTAVNRSATRP